MGVEVDTYVINLLQLFLNAPMASTTSTATEKKGKTGASSASTASGVSIKQNKPAVSKNIPPAAETKV
ncbi:hypothetical protein A2U01_0098967 [Trifolium medium]|nr:hypothetical protein [Trifolium medium]